MQQGCFTKRDKRDLANTSPPWSRCCDSLRTWCRHRVAFIISVRTLGRSSSGRCRLCIDSLQIRVGCNGVHASIDAWSIVIRPCTLYKMSVQLRSCCRYVMSASITDRPQRYRHIIDVVKGIRVVEDCPRAIDHKAWVRSIANGPVQCGVVSISVPRSM